MSLALPSAVCVAPRTQSQRSQRPASFGRRCPQYGHGILSPVVVLGWAGGASVYSTFILYRKSQAARNSSSKETAPNHRCLESIGVQRTTRPTQQGVAQLARRGECAPCVRLLSMVRHNLRNCIHLQLWGDFPQSSGLPFDLDIIHLFGVRRGGRQTTVRTWDSDEALLLIYHHSSGRLLQF